ncbi:hypothetical protein GPECTOR_4g924 [Gonium pectorale]|uniref:Methyltransferase small domain-containing protein n=1 Tax=Gonium pectorale TaxID=33097 RepID=A0A150GYR1_GONPE|nr:hypothetical protein GPECTOR_4g924 [Gonium pectorale]|eukprot:KXZ54852.1 hypothetical protein GPECTOR_4g924 [Gonium pectorale]
MALVPYRISGAAADQRADERLLQLPNGITLRLMQRPGLGGVAAAGCRRSAPAAALPLGAASRAADGSGPDVGDSAAGTDGDAMEWSGPPLSSLANVGLVVWQAGFLLADYVLRRPPFGGRGGDPAAAWRPLTAVDLGTGSGVVGIALALAGARVFLTDLPHVLPLAEANVAVNCDSRVIRATVCPYSWGDDPAASAATAAAAEREQHRPEVTAERQQVQGPSLPPTLRPLHPDVTQSPQGPSDCP